MGYLWPPPWWRDTSLSPTPPPAEESEAPAFTVGEYSSTFRCTKEEGWTVNGEPYNPDEDGVHQPERPLLAPLPPGTPWWARLLHWLGVHFLIER